MNRIVLTGPKHAGKTSAGRALTELLKARGSDALFIDLDELIEQREKKSPRELYRLDPGIFRKAEKEALQALLEQQRSFQNPQEVPLIVAAGGGIIDNQAALSLLKKTGCILIFLALSAETAWERIEKATRGSGSLPPFLDTDEPRETHCRLHKRRAEAYRSIAHITIDAENKSPPSIADEIYGFWRMMQNNTSAL